MLVLFGLIVRAVSVEYRGHDLKWAKVWDICFFIGSLLPALLLGVAVGNIFAGIPMSANGDYAGVPLLGLITPFTLLCGLLGLSMFLTQGASWLALKAPKPSDMQARVAKLRFPLQIVSLVLFVAVTEIVLMGVQPAMDPMLGAVRWWCWPSCRGGHRRRSSSRRQRLRPGCVHRAVGRGGAARAAACGFDVPELRVRDSRSIGRGHHGHERVVYGAHLL